MKNYQEMSDFEINKEVAEHIYPNADIPNQEDAWVDNDTECQVIIKTGVEGYTFDYCNNPSDAWPIIFENRIDISWPEEDCEVGTASKYIVGDKYIYYNFNFREQALRAAMIVFLMMKDSE